MYHWENDLEDFLVLAGEAILIVEGEERPVRRWDFVHCPPVDGTCSSEPAPGHARFSPSAPASTSTSHVTVPRTPWTRPRSATGPPSPRDRRRTGRLPALSSLPADAVPGRLAARLASSPKTAAAAAATSSCGAPRERCARAHRCPNGSVICPCARPRKHLRKLVRQHQDRDAERELELHQFVPRNLDASSLFGAENIRVPPRCPSRVAHRDVHRLNATPGNGPVALLTER
jgi:hypothetical protein